MTKAVAKQNTPKGKTPVRKSFGNSPKNTPNKKLQNAVAKTPNSAVKQTPKGTPRPQLNPAENSLAAQVTGKLSRSQRRRLAKKRKREQLNLLGQGSAAKGNSNKKQVIAKANGVNKNAKAKNEDDDDEEDEDTMEDESGDELDDEEGSDLGEEEESDDTGEEADSDDDDDLIKTEAKESKSSVFMDDGDEDDSEDEDDSDEDDSEDDLVLTENNEKKLKNQIANKLKKLNAQKMDDDDDDDEDEEDDGEEEEEEEEEDDDDEEEGEEEAKEKKTVKETVKKEKSTAESVENTVYIGNLNFRTKVEELKEFLESKLSPREIESVTMASLLKGRPRGFAFAKLANKAAYEKALKLDGEIVNERPLKVKPAEKKDNLEKQKPNFIRIKGVLNSVTDGQLLKLVVTKVKLESISSYNRRRGPPPIPGMVELVLVDEQDYEKLKQLNGSSLGGRAIEVFQTSKPVKTPKSNKFLVKKQSRNKQVGKNVGKRSPGKNNAGKFQGKGNKNQNKQDFNKGVKRGPQGDFNKAKKAKTAA